LKLKHLSSARDLIYIRTNDSSKRYSYDDPRVVDESSPRLPSVLDDEDPGDLQGWLSSHMNERAESKTAMKKVNSGKGLDTF
jgi:hypothetical protein